MLKLTLAFNLIQVSIRLTKSAYSNSVPHTTLRV